ncbi:hypothetical protein [Streptomyces sp. LS1784]|uniref:hypothetical protein n=1 Tax=Streptomyces sp. LS1784 TaxID=2851533 RepID=UPI001CD0366A|nr:hypothetical protein [Streptomyces sp. LS1784]
MSSTIMPSWRHPLLRLHHRKIEKRLEPAEKAAAELGVPFDADKIRRALAYDSRTLRGRLIGLLVVGAALAVLGFSLYSSMAHPSSSRVLHAVGTALKPILLVSASLPVMWLLSARAGDCTAPCYGLVQPLLVLLAASAAVATEEQRRYTEAAALADKTTDLRPLFHELGTTVSIAYGSAAGLRDEVKAHAERVMQALEETAADLATDHKTAARRLGSDIAEILGNLTSGRFTTLLGEERLPEVASVDPDRMAGRYLARACVKSALLVITLGYLAESLGAPILGVVGGTISGFFLVAYLLLARKHGLAEASRLIRIIKEPMGGAPSAQEAKE